MTVSLISAPVVCFDLVRHPSGAAIADTFRWALGLASDDRAAFVSAWLTIDHAARRRAWDAVRSAERERAAGAAIFSSARPALEDVLPVLDAGADLVGLAGSLRNGLIYDLEDMRTLVQEVLLQPTAGSPADIGHDPVVELIVDSIAGVWLETPVGEYATVLRAPLASVRTELGERSVGPLAEGVTDVVAALGHMGPSARARLRAVNTLLGPGSAEWAQSVHEASWAVLMTGRVREAASAQFSTLLAFSQAGFTADDGARGLWNLVSGLVAGRVVADVLPTTVRRPLERGWRAATFGF